MPTCPEIVGRGAELSILDQASAAGGMVLVSGEAGIGKSRLLREFAMRTRGSGASVVWGRPESVTEATPYSLILDLLDDCASQARHVREDVSRLMESLSQRAPLEPPRTIAARMRGVIAAFESPAVLILEDLHAADEMSHAVIAHLGRVAADDGFFVLASYRPEESSRMIRLLDLLTRDRLAAQLDLRPLTRDAIAEMIALMPGATEGVELSEIERLSEGIPFFVEELMALPIIDATESMVPVSVSRAVHGSLAQLAPDAARILKAASLVAGSIDVSILSHACDVPEPEIPRLVLDSVRAGLLRDEGGRLVFRHALVREAVAQTLSVEKKSMHLRLARATERAFVDSLDQHALTIANHFKEAGHPEASARFHLIAAQRSLDAGALDEAHQNAEFAVAKGDEITRARARVLLANAHIRMRRADLAESCLHEAVDSLLRLGRNEEAAAALMQLAGLRFGATDTSGGMRHLESAEALVTDNEQSAIAARLLIERGYALVRYFENVDEGEVLVHEGARRARLLKDVGMMAEASEALAWIATLRRNPVQADAHGLDACELARSADQSELIAKTHGNHALRLALMGRCHEALEHVEDARQQLSSKTGGAFLPSIEQVCAWVFWRMGRPADAYRHASRIGFAGDTTMFARFIRIWALTEQADLDAAKFDVDAWWGEVSNGAQLGDSDDLFDLSPQAHLVVAAQATVALATRDASLDSWIEVTRRHVARASIAAYEASLDALVLHARFLIASQDTPALAPVVAQLRELISVQLNPYREAQAQELDAELSAMNSGGGSGLFLASAERYAEAENLCDQGRVLLRAAEVAIANGDVSTSVKETLRRTLALADEAGAVALARRTEVVMRAVGMRPRAGRPKGPARPAGELSTREEEVVALLAHGATNAEISGRLFISERTVQDHIASAARRLNVSGRASLAAWAAKRGLV